MYLTSLTLSHFRSHKRAALDVDARPVAIYGPNGAGKTNLLEAVSLFSPGRGLRRAAAQDMARRPEALGWKISAHLHTADGMHEIASTSEKGAPRQVEIDGKPVSQIVLGDLARVVWLIPAMDRLWIEGAEGRRRFLDRTALSFFPDHAQAAIDYEKAMRDRNRLLRDHVRDSRWYGALEAQMARAGAILIANRQATTDRLTQAQQGVESSFPVAALEIVYPDGAAPAEQDALCDALRDSRPRDVAAGRSLVGPHRADLQGVFEAKGIVAAECSTGEQKALLLSLILANARSLAQDIGAPPLVLLDEVAAHLDPARRTALYDEICALGAQAWLTGTEPGLFDGLGQRAQYVSVSEEAGISVLHRSG